MPIDLLRKLKFSLFLFISTLLFTCNDSEEFSAGTAVEEKNSVLDVFKAPPAEGDKNNNDPASSDLYKYQLVNSPSQKIVAAADIQLVPSIFEEGKEKPLSEKDLKSWKVRYSVKDRKPSPWVKVEPYTMNLASYSDAIQIEAAFEHKTEAFSGHAQLLLFVDAMPPNVGIVEILDNNSDGKSFYWHAQDNYGLDFESITILACHSAEPGSVVSYANVEQLKSENCTVLPLSAEEAKSGGSNINIPAQLTINGALFTASDIKLVILAKDKVGSESYSWDVPLADAPDQLVFDIKDASPYYINTESVPLKLALELIQKGDAVTISDPINQDLWQDYTISLSNLDPGNAAGNDNNTPLETEFGKDITYELPPEEKTYLVSALVYDSSGLESNKDQLQIVLDKTPPVITNVNVKVNKGYLSQGEPVHFSWLAADSSPITKQIIEVKLGPNEPWVELAVLSGVESEVDITWNFDHNDAFEARIKAEDAATNVGVSEPKSWTPLIFNSAVLTQAVNCFFCHLRVEGDVAGINFTSSVHNQTGVNFDIFGNLFATGTVPNLLKKIDPSSGGTINENYQNEGIKIFPKDVDGDNLPDFPALTETILRPRMNGIIKTDNIFINRVHEGNIVLAGSNDKPIELSGEVLITGDLIIKGTYVGVGTIYARNIYIVNDLIAKNSPFPYPILESEALAKARLDIQNNSDGIYLAAMNQIVVGDLDQKGSTNAGISESPYQSGASPSGCYNLNSRTEFNWITRTDFEALGRKPEIMLNADNSFFRPSNINSQIGDRECSTAGFVSGNPIVDDYTVTLEVNRVDAYLFASNTVIWRAFANVVLNGGFMAPDSVFISSYPHRIWHDSGIADKTNVPVNPRNGLKANQNVIRYDYRLRAGTRAFETLNKLFFE